MLSVKLMMDCIGEKEKAAKLQEADYDTIQQGKVKTHDLGGLNSILEVVEEIIRVFDDQ